MHVLNHNTWEVEAGGSVSLKLAQSIKLVPGQLTVLHRESLFWKNMGWRDGLPVTSTSCSFRAPEFNSQQPHDKWLLTTIYDGYDAVFWHASMYADRELIQKKQINKPLKINLIKN